MHRTIGSLPTNTLPRMKNGSRVQANKWLARLAPDRYGGVSLMHGTKIVCFMTPFVLPELHFAKFK